MPGANLGAVDMAANKTGKIHPLTVFAFTGFITVDASQKFLISLKT